MPLNMVLLASGRGSNVEAVAKSIKAGKLDGRISAVITNNADAGVIEICRDNDLLCQVVPSKGLKRAEHEARLVETMDKFNCDFVVLAGYMRILSGDFLAHFPSPSQAKKRYFRVINIHPSLLPAFPGATAYADAFAAGVPESGITVHLVDEQVDHGPILSQTRFKRHAGDTFEDFACRGLEIEHKILPFVLDRVAAVGNVLDLDNLPFQFETVSELSVQTSHQGEGA